MTKLFEASWRDKYQFFERYFDTELNRSFTSEVTCPYEWYEPSSKGLYTYILDPSIKLEKRQGNAKQGRDHYGFLDPMYRNIRDNYWGKGKYNLKPRIWYLDIETRVGQNSTGFPVAERAAEQISMFQIYDNKEDIIIMLGLRDWKHMEDYRPKMDKPVRYIKFNNEFEMIEAYLNIFKKLDPLMLYAWNGEVFDFPYIYNRLKQLGFDTNRLSNHGNATMTQKEFQGQMEFNLKVDGHFYMDLMKVYQKFTFAPRASYSLDYIAEVEVGEKKVPHPEYAGFDDFYTGNYIIPSNPTEEQKGSKIYQEAIKNGVNDEVRELAHSEFCYYSYKDPLLIYKIDKKLNFTTLMLMIADKMGVTIADSMGTVKPWSQYIANRSIQDQKVMPMKQEHDHPYVVGGYVRDPQKGKHKWILSADVNSMYPLLGMVGFNMSPETFIPKHELPSDLRDIVLSYFNDQIEEKRLNLPPEVWETTSELLKEHNISLGINGAAFSKDYLGMIPEMVQEIYDARKSDKNTMIDYKKRKVLIKDILSHRNEED
ncbi:putative DNA polymerase [Vibrio phage phiKT1024]|nr:putative DNA polymerase [Vibrio phage phiKT1024]